MKPFKDIKTGDKLHVTIVDWDKSEEDGKLSFKTTEHNVINVTVDSEPRMLYSKEPENPWQITIEAEEDMVGAVRKLYMFSEQYEDDKSPVYMRTDDNEVIYYAVIYTDSVTETEALSWLVNNRKDHIAGEIDELRGKITRLADSYELYDEWSDELAILSEANTPKEPEAKIFKGLKRGDRIYRLIIDWDETEESGELVYHQFTEDVTGVSVIIENQDKHDEPLAVIIETIDVNSGETYTLEVERPFTCGSEQLIYGTFTKAYDIAISHYCFCGMVYTDPSQTEEIRKYIVNCRYNIIQSLIKQGKGDVEMLKRIASIYEIQ